jgi:hypothetical protein
VFGREPSRPLPRDDDSEPSRDIDLTEDPSGSKRNRDDPDRTEPMTVKPDDEEAAEPEVAERDEAAEPEVAERDEAAEPEVAERDEAAEPEVAERDEVAESGAAEPEVAERDEAAEPEVAERDEAAESDEAAATPALVGGDADEAEAIEAEQSGYPAAGDDGEAIQSPVVGSEVVPVVVDAEGVSSEPAVGPAGPDMSEMWIEIQAQFVDDPQAATAGALRMLRERLDGLAPAGATTEDLRVAFRRYRAAYFDLAEQ